jgi:AcrR family transcriptional regulator
MIMVPRMPSTAAVRDARTDGRLARSAGTRAAVVDALLALLHEGELRPTAPRIAERAGISLRSVFQHFPDMEAIYAAVAERQTERIHALTSPIPPTASRAERIGQFVAQRVRMFEMIAPVRRVAVLMEPFSPAIASNLRRMRLLGRTEVERVFAIELAAHRQRERRELVAALDVASSWATWDPLRRHQSLTVEQARHVMTRLLTALLSHSD